MNASLYVWLPGEQSEQYFGEAPCPRVGDRMVIEDDDGIETLVVASVTHQCKRVDKGRRWIENGYRYVLTIVVLEHGDGEDG